MSVSDIFGGSTPSSSRASSTQGPSENPGSRDAPADSPASATGSSSRDPRRSSLRHSVASSSSFGGIDPADLSANLERIGATAPSTLDANLREAHTGLVVSLTVEQRQRLLEAEVESFRAELEKHLRFDLPVEQVSEPLSSRQAAVAYHAMKFERDWCAARAFAYRELFEVTSRRMQALLQTDWQGENLA